MKDFLKKSIQFIRLLVSRILKNNIPGTSAEMSYYLILAFFPFLIFVITTFSYTDLFEYNLLETMEQFLPEEAYLFLNEIVGELLNARSGSLLSISMLTTIFFASKGIRSIISGINRSYLVTDNRVFYKKIFISLIFTLLMAISINMLFVFIVMGELFTETLFRLLQMEMIYSQAWFYLRIAISVTFIFLVVSFIYIFFPNLKPRLKFKEVYWGSIFTTSFWLISSSLFAFYVNNFSNYTLIYGSITGVILLLLWLFLSSILLLVGAEINALLKTMKMR